MKGLFNALRNPSFSSSRDPPRTPGTPVTPMAPQGPMRLVFTDDKGKFRMDPDAALYLHRLKGPLGVVSICGRARQGKSFILNQLLGRTSGFQVAPTQQPCTKGLWMWSALLKRTEIDGTEYHVLLLDTEGIDACDQTGTYSTQIFSLAVLLSSMFIYNQMGGIDEAALDQLSLVTKMTKYIRVRASEGQTTAAELGHYSPIFLWLLRDFYLELHEDGKRITPRDYLELALEPMEGSENDVATKNEIRESIRAMFPMRECFTLVRPVNEEHDLQRLDQICIDKFRPEFRAGLDALTEFIIGQTKPKQVGSTVMNGPFFAGLTQSFLDALNAGAVPTILTSWQNVEERECRRAYESSIQVYTNAFDKSEPPEEWALREAHDIALQKALAVFKSIAVGSTAARQEHKSMLHTTLKKQFEEYKANVFKEAEMKCSNACEIISKKLRDACNTPEATLEQVLEVLGHLVVEYENLAAGPAKTERLASFLHQSLQGPIRDLSLRLANQNEAEKTDLHLKFRSAESKIEFLGQQLEISQRNENDYLKKYEDAVSERSGLADEYASRLAGIQGQYTSLEEKYSKNSSESERKYDQLVDTQKVEEEHMSDDLESLKTRRSSSEARLSAACEQGESAKEVAAESRQKHDLAIKEVQKTVENITALKERAIQQTQEREDSAREFSATFAGKENKFQGSLEMLEEAEKMQSGLKNQLKVQEAELVSLREEVKDLREKLNVSNSNSDLTERNFQILEQDRSYLQQRLAKQVKWSKELEQKCDIAETNAKQAAEVAKKAQNDADIAQTEKLDFERLVKQRLTEIEGVEKHLETLEREKADLMQEMERIRKSEQDAASKVASLESRINEREREGEQFFQPTTEHRESTVQMLESLLATERDERLAEIRNAEKHLETLEREKANLIQEVDRARKSEEDVVSKLADLKSRIDELEQLQSTAEKRESTVQVLENLLATERASNAEANCRAEALSVQLQVTQGKLDALQQELNDLRLNENVVDNKPKATLRTRRAMKNEAKIEQGNAEKHLETLERENANLIQEVERVRKSEEDAVSKLADLKSRIDEKDREVEQLRQLTAEKRENTVQVLENLLATERASNAEANCRAEALSVQLQLTQGKLDALQQELNALHSNEKVMDNKPKTTIRTRKVTRTETKIGQGNAVGGSVQDVVNVDEDNIHLPRKRTRRENIEMPGVQTRRNNNNINSKVEVPGVQTRRNINNNNRKVEMPANLNTTSVFKPADDSQMITRKDSQDHTKLTVAKLKQELISKGFTSELSKLKNPLKKDILALYEKLILKR